VDRIGAYRPGWLVVAAVFALAGLMMFDPTRSTAPTIG
jgi:hypothetical protein